MFLLDIMVLVLKCLLRKVDVWSLKVNCLCVVTAQAFHLYHFTLLLIRRVSFGVPLLLVTYLVNALARLMTPVFTGILTFFQFHMVEWELFLFQNCQNYLTTTAFCENAGTFVLEQQTHQLQLRFRLFQTD